MTADKMGDNWQDDPAMKRAAFIGMIGNGSIPAADRIAMAQQVIRELEAELESATEHSAAYEDRVACLDSARSCLLPGCPTVGGHAAEVDNPVWRSPPV